MIDICDIDFVKGDGLVPVVIQDYRTLKVLMVGYMNNEAYQKSIKESYVTFYSRSKDRLWTKGESSGNRLRIIEVYLDCDGDTLLIKVIPFGPVCHKGDLSCFKTVDYEGFLGILFEIVKKRKIERPEKSYTTYLFDKGVDKICKKLAEECAETIIEAVKGEKEKVIYEASDLIYHLIVLLEECSISVNEIEEELFSRYSKN